MEVSCLKSLLAVARAVNQFVAFFFLSIAEQCERFIIFIPFSNVSGAVCTGKTDRYENG